MLEARRIARNVLVRVEKGGAFDELRGQTHIYRGDVANLPVFLPPLGEQRKIADILSAVDDAGAKVSALELYAEMDTSEERDLGELGARMLRILSVSSLRGYAAPEVKDDHDRAEQLL